MVGWRALDAEELVQDCPDVVLSVVRFALPDVQDDDANRLPGLIGGLHRERKPVAAVEVDAADDWLERPGQSVGTEFKSARIATELVVHALVAGSLSG